MFHHYTSDSLTCLQNWTCDNIVDLELQWTWRRHILVVLLYDNMHASRIKELTPFDVSFRICFEEPEQDCGCEYRWKLNCMHASRIKQLTPFDVSFRICFGGPEQDCECEFRWILCCWWLMLAGHQNFCWTKIVGCVCFPVSCVCTTPCSWLVWNGYVLAIEEILAKP